MEDAFFRQIRRNIEGLVIEGKLTDAYQRCKQVLDKYPNQRGVLDLKQDIEQKLLSQNKELVKEAIKEAKALVRKKELEKALRVIKKAIPLTPNDAKLKRLYLKIQKKYKETLGKAEKDFLDNKRKNFDELIEKEDFPKLINTLNTLSLEYSRNKEVLDLVNLYRERLVEMEVKKKQDLLNSEKFDDIKGFLKDLKGINPNSKTIKGLQEYISGRQMGHQVENIDEFIYSSQDSLETLMKLGKFEEAVRVATEILKTNPDSKKAKSVLKKARVKSFFLNQSLAAKKIKERLPDLKIKYKNNKENFVRI
jgi:tetratricopeptide (TPR) repeat protein